VAGVGIIVLGAVLLGNALGTFDLRFGAFAPLALFVVGGILLATGLSRRD
jgi:hypothetical protein